METSGLALQLQGLTVPLEKIIEPMERLVERKFCFPIVSANVAHEYPLWPGQLAGQVCSDNRQSVLDSIAAAEPVGPKLNLDVVVVAPATGNTLAKIANAVTDTAVTMAVKAQLRNERPVVLALATNDGLAGSARNIGILLDKKNVFFVPFGQDDPLGKPRSLVSDLAQLEAAIEAALAGKQIQPILLR